jgi:hypothetical protein
MKTRGNAVCRVTRVLALAVTGIVLTGCAGDLEELQQWTEAKRREAKPSVPKLQPPKKFDPEPYTSAQAVEPFSNQKLTVALKQEVKQLNPLLAARAEPPQGAAGSLSAGQHVHGGQRREGRNKRLRCCASTTCFIR